MSYQKECMYCKHQIIMSEETGKWLPYNKDGSAHDCRTATASPAAAPGPATKAQKQEQAEKKEITLEMVKKKLESIDITIDLDKLMKQQWPLLKTVWTGKVA